MRLPIDTQSLEFASASSTAAPLTTRHERSSWRTPRRPSMDHDHRLLVRDELGAGRCEPRWIPLSSRRHERHDQEESRGSARRADSGL